MPAARMWLIVLLGIATFASAQEKFGVERQEPKKLPQPKIKDSSFEFELPKETPTSPKPVPEIQGIAISQSTTPLTLQEVLKSVDENYPLLRAAEQERVIAGGRLLTAMGAFDTNLSFANTNIPEGTYENYRFTSGLNQAFSSTGIKVFSTYRGGYGDFPVYSGGSKTATGGEFRGGINVPLLRDGSIDRGRANLQQAIINRDAVEPFIDRQRLDFKLAATRVYWTWVASGERIRIIKSLVELAKDRDSYLGKQIELMLAAKIDRADNLQNLLFRSGAMVEAEQAFLQATVELSLFLRDASGNPLKANIEQIPSFPVMYEPDATQMNAAIQIAMEKRPELKRLRLQQQALQVELRLTQNQQLPALNAILAGSADTGVGKPTKGPSRLDRNSLEVGVEFQVPWQRRDAMGREQTAYAQLVQLAQQYRFQEDSIRRDVQSSFVAVERTFEQYKVARERVKYSRQVAEGERTLFRDGISELFRVNVREQAAFDAELIEVTAKLNYFRAIAEYKAALGISDP